MFDSQTQKEDTRKAPTLNVQPFPKAVAALSSLEKGFICSTITDGPNELQKLSQNLPHNFFKLTIVGRGTRFNYLRN